MAGPTEIFDLLSPLLVQPSFIITFAIMDNGFNGGESEAFLVCSYL
jgi:hypothetical protein